VNGVPQPQLGLIAVVFVIAGLGFRVAAVPSTSTRPTFIKARPPCSPRCSRGAQSGRLLRHPADGDGRRLGGGPASALGHRAMLLAWIIAVVTMTLGNTVALSQQNLKRLLAYSSIAHAGYLMIGVAVAFRNTPESGGMYFGAEGILFYLTAYAS